MSSVSDPTGGECAKHADRGRECARPNSLPLLRVCCVFGRDSLACSMEWGVNSSVWD